MSRRYLYYILILLLGGRLSAQQDPQYTHYMYNMSVVNPAYATAFPATLSLGGLYRSQWVGAVGAPKTMTFFGHMPVNKKVELGLSIVSDDIGDGAKKENNVYADFAYVLPLGGPHRLSLGLKGGFTSLNTNFNGFRLESGNTATDLAFAQDVRFVKPNAGAGLYYFTDSHYIGISVPNILAFKHIEERDGITAYGYEALHVFFTGGYVFPIAADVRLKPAFMVKFSEGSPATCDISLNALYLDRFELGGAYRVNESFSALMSVGVTPDIRIGYAYDYTTSNLGKFNSGSHEVFILFDLGLMGKGYDKSPRFF
jgi:type IX secretion system PorP/SprF family membrane protein